MKIKKLRFNFCPMAGFHLGFLSRGRGANTTIPELRGGAKTIICFSIREEGCCAH